MMENNEDSKWKWFNLQIPVETKYLLDFVSKTLKTNARNMANLSIYLATRTIAVSLGIAPLLDKLYKETTGETLSIPDFSVTEEMFEHLVNAEDEFTNIIETLRPILQEKVEILDEEVDELVESIKNENAESVPE